MAFLAPDEPAASTALAGALVGLADAHYIELREDGRMILPLGDSPNPKGVPWVTLALIGANVAVYLGVSLPLSLERPDPRDPLLLEYLRAIAHSRQVPIPVAEILRQVSQYDLFLFRHGFRPAVASAPDLFFSMFLHGGFLHLFGNMLFLWIYGDNVEHRLGRFPYLISYLATGALATLSFAAFALDSELPMVGASGAISGVLGFYFLWFPRNSVRLLVLLFPFLVDIITVPARFLLAFYVVVDNLLPLLLTRGSDTGVAYGAHIGGFLSGMAIAWMLSRRDTVRAPREYRERTVHGGASTSALHDAIAAHRFDEAAHEYFSLSAPSTRAVLSPEESLALAEALERDHPQAALTVYRRHLRDYPLGPSAAQAHFGVGRVLLDRFGQPAAAYQHFLEALDCDPPPDVAARARDALRRIEALQKFPMRSLSRR